MKYRFLVHYTTWEKSTGNELNYGSTRLSDNKYPTPEDVGRWNREISDNHSSGYRIDVISFSRMAKVKS